MTERRPPDDPDDENPEFDQFADAVKRLLDPKPADGPPEVTDAARQEAEYPADETNEG